MKKLVNPPPKWVFPLVCAAYISGLVAGFALALSVAP